MNRTADDWRGSVGDGWAREWQRTDRSFAELSPHLNEAILAAAPASGRAVDLGCGAGGTSIALARARPDLEVAGLDISAELIAAASERGRGIANLAFERADLAHRSDAVAGARLLFSRHGVMFFPDPTATFAALRRAAAAEALLVFSCFRDRAHNPWAGDLVRRVTGAAPPPTHGYAPGPFGFADARFVGDMLAAAGWRAQSQRVDFSYVAGQGVDPVGDAVGFLSQIGPVASAIRTAPDDQRPGMLHRLRVALHDEQVGDTVRFPASAWIWTAQA